MRNAPGSAETPRSAVETDMVQAGIMGVLIISNFAHVNVEFRESRRFFSW